MSDGAVARAERHGAWRTQDEIEFIDRLGTCAENLRDWNRAQLLAAYWRGCVRRSDWGRMDKDSVMFHLHGARGRG